MTTQHPTLVATHALEWEHNAVVLPELVRYSLAHVLMLAQIGVVPAERASALLGGLDALSQATLAEVPFDPALDGLQPSLERVLTRQLGPDVAGWLGAGRSRQECELVARQLANRDELRLLIGDVLALREVVAALAARHADALMPYHTWAQHAEPITLGYWYAAFGEGLCAEGERLEAAYLALDASRASCGQIVPPPWPIDRVRVARWLGFSRMAENSLHAYSNLDAELQVFSALASLANQLARLGASHHVWASDEFGFLSFADEMSGTSYAMPQKRNPYALRQLRPLASWVQGAWVEVAQLHGAGLPLVGDGLIHAGNRLMEGLPKVRLVVQLLVEALPGLRVNRERMAAGCTDNWIVAPQLAHGLTGGERLSFREAHALVHHLVLAMQASGRSLLQLVPADLVAAAQAAQLGPAAVERSRLDPAALRALLDPLAGLAQRGSGGPSAASVRSMLRGLKSRAGRHRRTHLAASAALAAAKTDLQRALDQQRCAPTPDKGA